MSCCFTPFMSALEVAFTTYSIKEIIVSNIINEVTISPGKITLQIEKEHCAIFIRAHVIWGLRLGLGLS